MLHTKKDGRRSFKPSISKDVELQSWLAGLRQDLYIITCTTAHLKAKQLIEDSNFKGLASCCTHFLCHNKQKTKLCQKLLADLDDKIISFHTTIPLARPAVWMYFDFTIIQWIMLVARQ